MQNKTVNAKIAVKVPQILLATKKKNLLVLQYQDIMLLIKDYNKEKVLLHIY